MSVVSGIVSAMDSTAQDHTWFYEEFPGLAQAYCITLVRGLAPAEVLRRLGAQDETSFVGVDGLSEMAIDGGATGQFVVAVTAVDGWALMVESNGYIGIRHEFITPLSHGTRLVAHYRNVNAVGRFCWAENEDIRLSFEPLFPRWREGSDPDALTDVMWEVGFVPDGDTELPTQAAFALAHRLTAIRLTPALLR